MKINIPFSQLLGLIRQLTPVQKQKLKKELENEHNVSSGNSLKQILVNGPVFTEEQIKNIEDAHKSVNKWRMK